MAQELQILLIDDLDGRAAKGTVRIGLDGTEYGIDLNAGHDRESPDALARYVNAARRPEAAPASQPLAAAARWRPEHQPDPRVG